MNYFIGIDIGGTNIRSCILDESLNIIDKFKLKNNVSHGPEIIIKKLCDNIKEKWSSFNIKAIGVGCPGPLDLKNGIIINPPNLSGWENFKIKAFIENEFSLPVVVNNDANMAGYSEAKVGAGKDAESVYYITLSTGVGGGYIYHGQIVNGFNNIAAEINNMIINEDSYQHSGLNRGGLEGQCSGESISRIASARFSTAMTAKDVFDRAKDGCKDCIDILNTWALHVAKAIANIVVVVDPEVFVLGGSVILHNRSYLDVIKMHVNDLVFSGVDVKIKLAEIGDDTGLIGSGILASACLPSLSLELGNKS